MLERSHILRGMTGGLIAAGLLLHFLGINPLVKRIWTPSWTLFSGGICFLLTAGFYWVADVRGWQAWGLPLAVLGMNSIAAYILEWIAPDWLRENRSRLPIVAFMAGRFMDAMPGMRFGHAGTIVEGKADTTADKIERMRAAGISVAERIEEIPVLLKERLAKVGA